MKDAELIALCIQNLIGALGCHANDITIATGNRGGTYGDCRGGYDDQIEAELKERGVLE